MNDWEKEQKELTNANLKRAVELSLLLGGTAAECCQRDFEINIGKAPGKGVTVVTDDRLMFKVFLRWPMIDHREYMPDDRPMIKVSKSRGMGALANEIQRRLLPDYDAAWNQQINRATKKIDDRARREAVLTEFAKLSGGRQAPSPHELRSGTTHCCYRNVYEIHVSEDGQRVTIKTSCMPTDVARKVLQAIIALNPRDA
jgi:hypothetical protein